MILSNNSPRRLTSKTQSFALGRALFQFNLIISIVSITILTGTIEAGAQQSATCRSLQAQLASIETGRGSGKSSQYEKYDRAMRQQLGQIKKTERAATRNGCQLLRTNACNRINTSLQSMYANMESLRRTRDASSGGGATKADRDKVIRALNRNGCLSTISANQQESAQPRRRTLLEQIFGTKTYSERGASIDEGGGISNPDLSNRSGTFRTLCVRTCDGYYFPISFSTSKNRFESDAEQCQQLCPGTETQLFYHAMPNGDAEESISYRTGEPYASLKNAFSYRKNVNSECSCRGIAPSGSFEEIAGTTESEKENIKVTERVMPTPSFRADQGIDLESEQNLIGGLTLERLAAINDKSTPTASLNKEIRIVGPEFFPVQ